MAVRGSVVVRRQLGGRLRSLREDAGKTIRDVAEAKLFSQSKMFRLESGRVPARMGDVWALCRFYGVDSTVADALARLAEGVHNDHWWEDHDRASPNWFHLYRSLESTCTGLFAYHPELVPGLLQTDEYTELVIATDGEVDEEVIRERLDIRLERKLSAFSRENLQVTMVVGAAALTRGIASSGVIQRQFEYLCDISSGEHVQVRILPSTMGVRARLHGQFTLMDFEDPADPSVAYVETHVGAHYFEGEAYVARYRQAMLALIDASIPVKEFEMSTSWIKATASQDGVDCVEMREHEGHIEVRDSKNPEGPGLRFTPGEWAAWLDGAKKGEFDHLV